MTRMLSVLPLIVSGCIIYEEDWDDRGECYRCPVESGPDGGYEGGTAGGEEPDPSEPEEPEGPALTGDLELTESEAYPGDSLLSSLVVVSGQVDLDSVVSVGFERDVEVADMLPRSGEIVLLLEVAHDAVPGEVDVFVETGTGPGYILEQPFVVLDPDAGDPADPGTSGGGTTDPGTGTECP